MAIDIIDYSKKFQFVININTETCKEILDKVDSFLKFLNDKRYNIAALSRSLYILRKFADRINRYKKYRYDIKLSPEDCDHIYYYIKESILKFLQSPVDGNNIYLYNPLIETWIAVSPKSYLWLIYGPIQRQIHLLGLYIEELLNEYETQIELKDAVNFVNKFLILTNRRLGEPILSTIFKDDVFYANYKKLITLIDQKSVKVNQSYLNESESSSN